jgi:hypothetical protein
LQHASKRSLSDVEVTMLDIVYVIGTVAFFALMLAYAAGCAKLGSAASQEEQQL